MRSTYWLLRARGAVTHEPFVTKGLFGNSSVSSVLPALPSGTPKSTLFHHTPPEFMQFLSGPATTAPTPQAPSRAFNPRAPRGPPRPAGPVCSFRVPALSRSAESTQLQRKVLCRCAVFPKHSGIAGRWSLRGRKSHLFPISVIRLWLILCKIWQPCVASAAVAKRVQHHLPGALPLHPPPASVQNRGRFRFSETSEKAKSAVLPERAVTPKFSKSSFLQDSTDLISMFQLKRWNSSFFLKKREL